MFKFFTLCLLAVIAAVAAKPAIVAPLAYSSPLIASPYTAAYTAGYASPYVAAASPYVASPYAAYSAYPYAASYYVR
ncbi:cuticle protein 5.1-like [Episyrphus balteatus]|uniref:cuticle protein 5.1-like n=1 Tax=Episyrphus balteatus TaxID=286459 RepID=UPI0024852F05|nr:cuticle protein 5.1-like [Episyrphus balteatus]XP_055840435.1 cuticle protein 5.1-like [Episyrphus balteatus]